MHQYEVNIATLAAAGYTFAPPDMQHLGRHFDDHLEVGSKLPTSQKEAIVTAATEALAAAFAQMVRDGKPIGRVEVPLAGFSGFGALVPLQAGKPVIRVRRDPGTPHEYVVNCHLVDSLPADDRVVVIGGRYGPTEKVGLYTIVVGDSGKPMPRQGDTSDTARELAAYWEGMAFLITQAQLDAAVLA
jgi:hypothetical protein